MTHADDRDQPLKPDAETAAGEKPNPDDPKADLPFMASWRTYKLLGYSPIPLHPFDVIENGQRRSKVPWPKEWPQWARAQASDEQCQQWERDKPASGVGLACGFDRLVVVDIDTLDRALQEAIRAILPKTVWRRGDPAKGGAGFFRLSRSLETVPFKELTVDGQKAVEILWTGRQVATYPTMHPSGERYRFEGREGYPPDLSDLPELTAEHFERLAERVGAVPGAGLAAARSATAAGEVAWSEADQIFDLVDDAEAERLGRELLARKLPAFIPLGERHEKLVALVLQLGDAGLSPERARDMLVEAGAHDRCSPPISEGDLRATTAGLEFPGGRKTPIGVRRPEYRAKKRRKKAAAFLGVAEDEIDEGAVETYFAKYPELNEAFSAAAQQATREISAEAMRRFTPVPAGDFIRDRFLNASDAWTWERIFPKAGVGEVFGPSGSTKSFQALAVAAAVAAGESHFGAETLAGPVVYIAAEGQAGVAKRLAALFSAKGLPQEGDGRPLFVIPDAPNLGGKTRDDHVELIAAIHSVVESPRMVVIDTLAQTLDDGEENTTGMAKFVQNAQKISQTLGCFVLVVHHSGWSNTERERGGSQLRGACDCVLRCERDVDKPHLVTLLMMKEKDEDDQRKIVTTLRRVVLRIDAKGREVSSLVVASGSIVETEHAKPDGVDINKAADILRKIILTGDLVRPSSMNQGRHPENASDRLVEALDLPRRNDKEQKAARREAQKTVDRLIEAGVFVVGKWPRKIRGNYPPCLLLPEGP